MGFDFSLISILNILFYLLVILLSLSVHESAHAWTAWKLGDPTAKMLGRVTLNPIPHIDPIGTVLLPLLMVISSVAIGGHAMVFGWAKPVPVISRNFKHIRRDGALVAAAGPASNLALAALMTLALVLSRLILGAQAFGDQLSAQYSPMWALMSLGITNLALAAFNMIPVPPLDGSWVLSALLPHSLARGYEQIRPYGTFILLFLMISGAHRIVLAPAVKILFFAFYIFPLGLKSMTIG